MPSLFPPLRLSFFLVLFFVFPRCQTRIFFFLTRVRTQIDEQKRKVEALDQTFREAQRNLKNAVTQLKDKIEDMQRKINQANDEKDKGMRRFEDQKVNLQRRMGETSEKKRLKISELEQAMEEHEVSSSIIFFSFGIFFPVISFFLIPSELVEQYTTNQNEDRREEGADPNSLATIKECVLLPCFLYPRYSPLFLPTFSSFFFLRRVTPCSLPIKP